LSPGARSRRAFKRATAGEFDVAPAQLTVRVNVE
jgi:hypothetical protein